MQNLAVKEKVTHISSANEEESTETALDRIGWQDLDFGKQQALTNLFIHMEEAMNA